MKVVEVNDPSDLGLQIVRDSGLQTVRDPRFGPKGPGDICSVCANAFINCVGHYGRIRIVESLSVASNSNQPKSGSSTSEEIVKMKCSGPRITYQPSMGPQPCLNYRTQGEKELESDK